MSNFWGLTVNVGKKFKQHVQEAFCISGAALEPLDVSSGKYDDKAVQLFLQQDHNDYLICSLSPKQGVFQAPLDVRVGCGETVGFHIKGGSEKSKVHLTGFTIPKGDSLLSVIPFKGQQQSILVTEPKSEDKLKKRVSIKETESYGEVELESSGDDDDEMPDIINRKLFNGKNSALVAEGDSDDDDDDDDEDSDSDLGEDEIAELQQMVQKGKYNPKTGGKVGEDDDSDVDLDDDDEDEDDSSEDEDLEVAKKPQVGKVGKIKGTPQNQKQGNVSNSATPKTPENQHLQKLKTPSSAGHTPMKSFNKGGILVNDLKVGNGQIAKSGKMATVYYSGRLKSNNKQFDASQSGPGFRFRLGKGEVIKGWDIGVEGMKVGGKRRLIIPAQLAYGKKGAPPDIPPNSTLTFEVELKNVS